MADQRGARSARAAGWGLSMAGPDGPPLPVEDVQAYPRPPALEPVPQRLTARVAGLTVLDTTRALRVLETHHAPTYYIPPGDVTPGVLIPLRDRGSFCEWKGRASYFDLRVAGHNRPRAAWCYTAPSARFAALAGYIAFYATALDQAHVGDAPVQPQPGDFYGGWVTANLRGQIKGAPGTRHW